MTTVYSRQNFIVLIIFALILAVSGLLIYCLVGDYRSEVRRQALFADRDFQNTPFALTDAIIACDFEARERYGDSLLRSFFDDLSSRYEERKQRYLVVMRGDVGEINHHEEVMIFCDVDSRQHAVTYYQSVYREPGALFENPRKLFD